MTSTIQQRAIPIPKILATFENNSTACDFYDIKDNPCTRSLKNFVGSQVGSHVVETFVRTLGPKKAEQLERTFQEPNRHRKRRSFGLQWCDLMEKDRLKGSEYQGKFCHRKELPRRSLSLASLSGREMIKELKAAGDDRRLNKIADMCRGLQWVKEIYESTQSSEAQAKYIPIDLNSIERHTLPQTTDSDVPLGTIKALKEMKDWPRPFIPLELPPPPTPPLLIVPRAKMRHDGEGTREAFTCGFNSDQWRSETRAHFEPKEKKVKPKGGNLSRGFGAPIIYPETLL